jgi:hypothetical protein
MGKSLEKKIKVKKPKFTQNSVLKKVKFKKEKCYFKKKKKKIAIKTMPLSS